MINISATYTLGIRGRTFLLASQVVQIRSFSQNGPFFLVCLKTILQGVQSPFCRSFHSKGRPKTPTYLSPIPEPVARKEDYFQHPWGDLIIYFFPLFVLLRQILSRVMLSRSLCDPGGFNMATKGVFPYLVALLVEEPLELPMLWNLLVQPHVRKFHRGLELLCLHTWNLSSDSSTRQAFVRRLHKSSLHTSGNPHHVSFSGKVV